MDHKHLLRAGLLASTMLSLGGVVQAEPALTRLPTGGQVIGGSASITQSAAAMQVSQSSANAALNWQSFSVGGAAKVSFTTPTAQSLTINRVVGPDPSVIAGQVSSNGRLVLVNQSGITVVGGAKIDAQSLVLSAPGITEANARAGNLVFDQPARADAMVTNAGTLTVAKTGLAALVAPAVANSGVIRAPMGRVVLAGAEAHVVDLYGDGLLGIDVTRQVTSLPVGADGQKVTALVTNSGIVRADGGSVTLTASAVEGLVSNLVNAGGRISASSANGGGSVTIHATGGGVAVAPSARISARGGTVSVIASGAAIQAGTISARGGAVEVSGSRLVLGGPITAAHILLDPTDVVIGSTLGTAASGSTLLTPTALLAMSGDVTISATGSLSVNAALDFTKGSTVGGLALLAANDINVNAPIALADAGHRLAITSTAGSVFLGAPVNAGVSGVLDLSAGANLFQTSGAITAGTLTSATGIGGTAILQQPGNQIASLGNFSVPNGRLVLNDDLALTQTGDVTANNAVLFDRASGTALNLAGQFTVAGELVLSAGRGISTASLASLPAIRIGSGATIQAAALSLYSTNRDITNAVTEEAGAILRGPGAGMMIDGNIYAGSVTLSGTANAVSGLAGFNLFGGDLTLASAQAMTVSAPLTGRNVLLVVAPSNGSGSSLALGITGDVTVAGTLAIFASGNIVRSAGSFSVGTLTGHALHLADFGHRSAIQTLGDFTVDGSVLLLDNAAPLVIQGNVQTEFFNISATGSLVLAGNIVTLGVGRAQSTGAIDTNVGSTLSVVADAAGNAQFQQVGISTISSSNGTIATVRISLPSVGGSIVLNDLSAPSTDLVVFNPAGTLSGSANIGGLVVVGRGSGTDLSGSVGSVGTAGGTTTTTTSLSSPDSLYRANACAIGAVNCLLGPVNELVPLTQGASVPALPVAPGEIEIILPHPDRRASNEPGP